MQTLLTFILIRITMHTVFIELQSMYVCVCNGITDRALQEAVRAGAHDLDALSAATGCATVCGSCGELAQEILRETRRETLLLPTLAAA